MTDREILAVVLALAAAVYLLLFGWNVRRNKNFLDQKFGPYDDNGKIAAQAAFLVPAALAIAALLVLL